MTITVFGKPPTRALRVIWMLEEMGLPYEVHAVQFGQHLQDVAFMKANPAGLIPAITDGDVSMAESVAIMEYLGARHGPTPLVPERDDPSYPKYVQFLHYGEASLAAPLNVVVMTRFMAPEDQKSNWGAAAAADMCLKRTTLALDQLSRTPFLAGETFTAADISVGYSLYIMDYLGLGERLDPKLSAWSAKLQDRPAFKRALAA